MSLTKAEMADKALENLLAAHTQLKHLRFQMKEQLNDDDKKFLDGILPTLDACADQIGVQLVIKYKKAEAEA